MTRAGGYYLGGGALVLTLWAVGTNVFAAIMYLGLATAYIEIIERHGEALFGKFKAVVCAVLGHSHLVTNCCFYKYCARCGEQVADQMIGTGLSGGPGGYYQVGQTCKCDYCRQAFDTLRFWRDKWLCPKATWPE